MFKILFWKFHTIFNSFVFNRLHIHFYLFSFYDNIEIDLIRASLEEMPSRFGF